MHEPYYLDICCVPPQEMIENYVHWNEDIGEWQLVCTHACLSVTSTCILAHLTFWTCACPLSQKCVAYTGNNMRKQTPAVDKKEKDVSLLHGLCSCPSVCDGDPLASPCVSCSPSRWTSPTCIWPTRRRACSSRWWDWSDHGLRKVARAAGLRRDEGADLLRNSLLGRPLTAFASQENTLLVSVIFMHTWIAFLH